MSTTPPRNVIYYNDGSNAISLTQISSLPYTDVILAFLGRLFINPYVRDVF